MAFLAWGAALVWYLAAPTQVAAVGLAGLSGLLLAGWLWARSLARGLTAQRDLHYAAVQVGDAVEEHLQLINNSALPVLWAEFDDRSDLPGYVVSSVRALNGRSRLAWRVNGTCSRRGLYTLGPWELRTGDPFGLFLVRQVHAGRQELLVYPPLAPLPPRLQPHARRVGDQSRLRQPLPAESINAATTRPYQPGDPLRHMHWPTSARRGQPYARVFEPEATSTVWLLPDFDAAAHLSATGSEPGTIDTTEELMVLLAASLADALLRRQLAVGLLAYTREAHVLRPQRGRGQLWPVLRALAPLHADCAWPLAETLARLQPLFSTRDRLVVLTPSFDIEWPRALRDRGRQSSVECLLLDRAGFGGEGQAEPTTWALAEQSVTAQVLLRGELEAASAAYGALRRWEFQTLGTGRVIAKQTPRQWQPGAAQGQHAG